MGLLCRGGRAPPACAVPCFYLWALLVQLLFSCGVFGGDALSRVLLCLCVFVEIGVGGGWGGWVDWGGVD
jgi:hypothetical protein